MADLRYNISSGVPGGVAPEGMDAVTAAATGLADKIAAQTKSFGEQLATPAAEAKGAAAGADLGWQPIANIGEVARAYNAAAEHTHDVSLHNSIRDSMQEVVRRYGLDRDPEGAKKFDPLADAATDKLLQAVTPASRGAVAALRDSMKSDMRSKLVESGNEIATGILAQQQADNFDGLSGQYSMAMSQGDTAEATRVRGLMDSQLRMAAGQPVNADGKPVSFDEYIGAGFDKDGNPLTGPDGSVVRAEDKGYRLLTPPVIPLPKLIEIRRKADDEGTQARILGDFRTALAAGRGAAYIASFEHTKDSGVSHLSFQQTEEIHSKMTHELRASRVADDRAIRQAQKDDKDAAAAEFAVASDDLMEHGQLEEGRWEKLKSMAHKNPSAFLELARVRQAHNAYSDDSEAIGEINDKLAARDRDGAAALLDVYTKENKITPTTYSVKKQELDKLAAASENSVLKSPSVAPVMKSLKGQLALMAGGSKENLATAVSGNGNFDILELMTKNNETRHVVDFWEGRIEAEVEHALSGINDTSKQASVARQIIATRLAELTSDNTRTAAMMKDAAVPGGADVPTIPLPLGAANFIHETDDGKGGSVAVFDSTYYLAAARAAFNAGRITKTDYADAIVKARNYAGVQRRIPAMAAWQAKQDREWRASEEGKAEAARAAAWLRNTPQSMADWMYSGGEPAPAKSSAELRTNYTPRSLPSLGALLNKLTSTGKRQSNKDGAR